MRITVIGSVLGACGQDDPGWIVVRLVNGSITGRAITLLAIGEHVTTKGVVEHRAGAIPSVTWANWTTDYPSDCSMKVRERMYRWQHFLVTKKTFTRLAKRLTEPEATDT